MAAGAGPEPICLNLEGRATIQGHEVTHAVVPCEDMMQAFAYRHLVPSQDLKVIVSGREFYRSPVRILGEGPTRIPAGGTASVRLGVPPYAPLDKIEFALSDPPEGISIKNVSLSREVVEISIQCDADKVKPGQKGNLILTASGKKSSPAGTKAKFGKQKNFPSFTLPAVPFEITSKAPT